MTLLLIGNTLAPFTMPSTSTPQTIWVVEEATCSFDGGICPSWKSEGLFIWKDDTTTPTTSVQSHSGEFTLSINNQLELSLNQTPLFESHKKPLVLFLLGYGFAYVEKEPIFGNNAERYAELETAVVRTNNSTSSGIMTFWYLFGNGIASLDLYLKKPDQYWTDPSYQSTLWTATHTINTLAQRKWRLVSVPFCLVEDQSFVFRLTPSRDLFTVAALDEVFTVWDASMSFRKLSENFSIFPL